MELEVYPYYKEVLETFPQPVITAVASALNYLRTFGRSAALPDVRHHLGGHPDLSEIRVQLTVDGRRYTVRVLVIFHDENTLFVSVIGDKDSYDPPAGKDWYDMWIPVALTLHDRYRKGLTS